MRDKNAGEIIHQAFYKFMPYYFRCINPIVHRLKIDECTLNENQIKVIMAIDHINRTTPTELSNHLYIRKGSLTTIIRSLLKMGLIKKENDIYDERKYYMRITSKGKIIIKKKNINDIQHFNKMFEKISDEDVQLISEGFQKLSNYLLIEVEKNENTKQRI